MPFLTLPTATLYYEQHGAPHHPPLLLLHGAAQTFHTAWSRQIPVFAGSYHVIGVDLRGHGRSENQLDCLDLRQMATDAAALLTHLHINAAHVCGHSGGASVALYLAVQQPHLLRSLVLINSNYTAAVGRAARLSMWDAAALAQADPVQWQRLAQIHQTDPARLLAWWRAEDAVRPDFDADVLHRIHLPALLIAGDRDPMIPLEHTLRFYHALPDARLAILPAAGHHLPQHHSADLNRLVLTFLTTLSPEKS